MSLDVAIERLEAVSNEATRWTGECTFSGLPAHQLREVIKHLKTLAAARDRRLLEANDLWGTW